MGAAAREAPAAGAALLARAWCKRGWTPPLSPEMCLCGGTLWAGLAPRRSGLWARGLLVLAGGFRASPPPQSVMLVLWK